MGSRKQGFDSDSCVGQKFLLCLQLLWYQKEYEWGLLVVEDRPDDMAGVGRRSGKACRLAVPGFFFPCPKPYRKLELILATFIEHIVCGRHCSKPLTYINSFHHNRHSAR